MSSRRSASRRASRPAGPEVLARRRFTRLGGERAQREVARERALRSDHDEVGGALRRPTARSRRPCGPSGCTRRRPVCERNRLSRTAAASKLPSACSRSTTRDALPGATAYQTVPPAREHPFGSLSSLVAPSVVALTWPRMPIRVACRDESFAGGRNSCAFSVKPPSAAPFFLPTSTRYELPRVVSHRPSRSATSSPTRSRSPRSRSS